VKALIIIDVQHALFNATPAPTSSSEVVERINTLTQRARQQGAPVVFVQHEATAGDFFRHGSPEWALDARLTITESDHIVAKTTPDAFLNTELEAVLSNADISHVVVCGYATEYCIDTTVRRAAGLGYEVTLVSDAHTTQDKSHAPATQIITHHNATLASVKSYGGAIHALETSAVTF